MAPTPHIKNVIIVGAAGRIGGAFAEALVKTGEFNVTSLTRPDSKGKQPEGVKVVRVDYDEEDSLVSALKGQQFLIITLGVRAPPDLHSKIVAAAGKAGVPYIMPNIYGSDILNEKLCAENLYGDALISRRTEIESAGASWIVMVCGFWYQWSLALGEPWYGFDIKNKKVTFIDDGKTAINTSTWPQCGRALAAVLSLPESGASPSLADYKNKPFYFDSFKVSQRDMLDSIHRVTGSTDADWEITNEPSTERYHRGLKEMKEGKMTGFATAMYTRTFYPNGDGDYESTRGLSNDLLGLPKEDLDQATKEAVDMVNSGWNPFAQY